MKYATLTQTGFEIRIGGEVPPDAIVLTDAEFDGLESGQLTITDGAIVAAQPATISVIEQLYQLDAANTLTQRNLRETVMLMSEAFKQVTGGAVDLSAIPGVAKVYAVEVEAEALRAQL